MPLTDTSAHCNDANYSQKNLLYLTDVGHWVSPNPHLQTVFNTAIVDVTTSQVCWHFDLYNQPISTTTTDAQNIFMVVPDSTIAPYLTNWYMNWHGGIHFANSSGIINMQSDYPVGKYTIGTICATYNL